MASWITHLRLADALLAHGWPLDATAFAAGSVGPDSGLPVDPARGIYDPPKEVTHLHGADGLPQADAFARAHLPPTLTLADARHSYLVGYWLHLLTDRVWLQTVGATMKAQLGIRRFSDRPDLSVAIKDDLAALDFAYLRATPGSLYARVFAHITTVPDVLPFFPSGALTAQVRAIQECYNTPDWAWLGAKTAYPYFDAVAWQVFIDQCAPVLHAALAARAPGVLA